MIDSFKKDRRERYFINISKILAFFFRTLDIVLSVGAAETWNVQVGTVITNALIGNDDNNGLAYALRGIGATDYAFSQEGETAYFSVLR